MEEDSRRECKWSQVRSTYPAYYSLIYLFVHPQTEWSYTWAKPTSRTYHPRRADWTSECERWRKKMGRRVTLVGRTHSNQPVTYPSNHYMGSWPDSKITQCRGLHLSWMWEEKGRMGVGETGWVGFRPNQPINPHPLPVLIPIRSIGLGQFICGLY